MAVQYSDVVEHASLDARETAIGASPTLEIRTGAAPANCAAADTGSLLATVALPADWMAAASARSKAKAGTWSVAASGTGTAGHFRIKQGATCHIQGPITMGTVAVEGEMVLVNTSVAATQVVTINQFTLAGEPA